jgi:hypothetical protein
VLNAIRHGRETDEGAISFGGREMSDQLFDVGRAVCVVAMWLVVAAVLLVRAFGMRISSGRSDALGPPRL